MRNGEPNIYVALATLRGVQTRVQWSRIQMAAVFNTIALPLVFGLDQPELTRFVISVAGFALHVAFLVAARRGDRWVAYWDARMVELERLDQKERSKSVTRVAVFSRPAFKIMRGTGLTSRRIFGFIGIVITFL